MHRCLGDKSNYTFISIQILYSSSSFLLGLCPVVCLYQSSSDVDVQLSRHLLGCLSGGSVGAQLAHLSCPILSTWSLQFRLCVLTHLANSWGSVGAQLAHLSCPILSTWSLQFRLHVITHLATSIALHSAHMLSLLIRSLKVTPFIFLKTLISADLNSC
jgi:hypothetical protein